LTIKATDLKSSYFLRFSVTLYSPLISVLYFLYQLCKSKGWLSKKQLKGEHVFLTGAGSGLGKLMAIELAKQGANLSLSDINEASLGDTSKIRV